MPLTLLKKSLEEVAILLAQNKTICSLLVNDEPNACEATTDININDLISEDYISFFPPIDINIENNTRNTFLCIFLDQIEVYHNVEGTILIFIGTNKEHNLLNNNKSRLLELADSIIHTLNGAKLSSAGAMSFDHMSYTMLSNFHAGYKLTFNISDQQVERTEL